MVFQMNTKRSGCPICHTPTFDNQPCKRRVEFVLDRQADCIENFKNAVRPAITMKQTKSKTTYLTIKVIDGPLVTTISGKLIHEVITTKPVEE